MPESFGVRQGSEDPLLGTLLRCVMHDPTATSQSYSRQRVQRGASIDQGNVHSVKILSANICYCSSRCIAVCAGQVTKEKPRLIHEWKYE